MRVFVFGDTGGHLEPLQAALENQVGLDMVTKKLPEDVLVIHCGDLIHKGPFSEKIIELVDSILENNPGQWIQLLGNHELHYFRDAPFFWNAIIQPDAQRTIGKWYQKGWARIAYALPAFQEITNLEISAKPKISVPNKPIFFSHAGLTYPFWEEFGFETDAVKLAEAINKAPIEVTSRPGVMLDGRSNLLMPVAPTWAHVTAEVWESWRGKELPFILVHGHSNAFDFRRRAWWSTTPLAFRNETKLNPRSRTATTTVGNSLQIAIDPGYEVVTDQQEQSSLQIII